MLLNGIWTPSEKILLLRKTYNALHQTYNGKYIQLVHYKEKMTNLLINCSL